MIAVFWVELSWSFNAQFVKCNKVCPFDKLVPKNKQIFFETSQLKLLHFPYLTKPSITGSYASQIY